MKHKPSIPNYSDYGKTYHNFQGSLLDLFNCPSRRHKPQISSIPGISSKESKRYRVMLGDQVLGNGLTANEALQLAKEGGSAISPLKFS
jgi:hypothetical protein